MKFEDLVFVTGNDGKVRDAEIFLGMKIERVKIDLPEIQAVESKEILEEKLDLAIKKIGRPLLVDDTGLHFEGMGGFPGALVKWMIESAGLEKMCRCLDGVENRKVVGKMIIGFWDGEKKHFFEGVTEGEIAENPRGENGHGWDPIFIPEGEEKTFAEMSDEERWPHFPRAKALLKLKEFLTEQNG